jgi:hypothetical protein
VRDRGRHGGRRLAGQRALGDDVRAAIVPVTHTLTIGAP